MMHTQNNFHKRLADFIFFIIVFFIILYGDRNYGAIVDPLSQSFQGTFFDNNKNLLLQSSNTLAKERSVEHLAITTDLSNDYDITLHARTIEVYGCTLTAPFIRIDADSLSCGATVSGQFVTVESADCVFQKGTFFASNGNILAHYFKAEPFAQIEGETLTIEAHSFEGQNDSFIKASNKITIRAAALDNKGTLQGSVDLAFEGLPEQLKSIGTIDCNGGSFSYKGPIAQENGTNVPSIDELLQGSGSWGSISNAQHIIIHTDSDIHIKNEHTIVPSVGMITQGTLRIDKSITCQGSLCLHTAQSLWHESLTAAETIECYAAQDIISESRRELVQSNPDWEYRVNAVCIKAGKSHVSIAGRDIIHGATIITAGNEGIIMAAVRNIIDKDISSEYHAPKYLEKTYVKDSAYFPCVSRYTSQGNLFIEAGEKYLAQAPVFEVKGEQKIIEAGHQIHLKDIYNRHTYESHRYDEGWFIDQEIKKNTESYSSVGSKFIGQNGSPILQAQEIMLINPSFEVVPILKGERAEIILGKKGFQLQGRTTSGNIIWESEKKEDAEDITYPEKNIPGIENHTNELLIESVEGKPDPLMDTIVTIGEGKIHQRFVQEIHRDEIKSSFRLTTGARVVLAIALGLLAPKIGVGIGGLLTKVWATSPQTITVFSNMGAGACVSLMNNATNALIESQGNIQEAAHKIVSVDTFKIVALAAVCAGLATGVNQLLNDLQVAHVHDATSYPQRLAYAAPRELVQVSIKTCINILIGQPIDEALLKAVPEVAARTFHISLVTQIAHWYGSGTINGFTHKVFHAGAGALYGGAMGGKEGAVAGGLGACAAEVYAEIVTPSKQIIEILERLEQESGCVLSHEEFIAHYAHAMQEHMQKVMTTHQSAQCIAALSALIAKQDVDLAHQAALNALDNNYLFLLYWGATAAGIGYSVYKVQKSYKEGGEWAALKQLGIEVTWFAAGYATVRVGRIFYPTFRAAVVAVLDANPVLKCLMGKFADKLIKIAVKIDKSAAGQAITKFENKLIEQQAKLWNKCCWWEKVPKANVPGYINLRPVKKPVVFHSENKIIESIKPTIIAENEYLLQTFNPANYDPKMICHDKLIKAIQLFGNTEGAMNVNGPLRRVLEFGNLESIIVKDAENMVRGAAFELERGLLVEAESNVMEFGSKYYLKDACTGEIRKRVEVDIVTVNKFIECKNVEWSKWKNWTEKEFNKAMGKIKGQLGYLQKLSIQEGKTFELHSKHSIMKELTEWLIKENIKFYEG